MLSQLLAQLVTDEIMRRDAFNHALHLTAAGDTYTDQFGMLLLNGHQTELLADAGHLVGPAHRHLDQRHGVRPGELQHGLLGRQGFALDAG